VSYPKEEIILLNCLKCAARKVNNLCQIAVNRMAGACRMHERDEKFICCFDLKNFKSVWGSKNRWKVVVIEGLFKKLVVRV
jgi:hypothetical protein